MISFCFAFNRKTGVHMRSLRNVLLYTVDNDPESRLIYLIALCLGIYTIRSPQPHGALLDNEQDAVTLVRASGKREVWTVELPGEYTENKLRKCGINVVIIDHHTYGKLDRAHNPETGERKKSSLEQFLELLKLTDNENALLSEQLNRLVGFGTFNREAIIKGIGILDDRYVKGLHEAGYDSESIRHVFQFRDMLHRQLDKEFDAKTDAAKTVWEARKEIGDYVVCISEYPFTVTGAVSTRSVTVDSYFFLRPLEAKPMIVSDCGGKKLRVLNISPETIEILNAAFEHRHRFTYGAGRCWGSGGDLLPTDITLEELLAVLT